MERQTVLVTRRLLVTTWVPSDADDLYDLHSDPRTMRFVGPGRPETRAECDRRLASYLDEQHVRGWTKWRVQTREGAMLGRAGFGAYGPNPELGYTLRPACWGQAWRPSWRTHWWAGTPSTRSRTGQQNYGPTQQSTTSRAAGCCRRPASSSSTFEITTTPSAPSMCTRGGA